MDPSLRTWLTLDRRERIVLPLWRSINSINLMLPKEERKAMLLRLFNDESELVDHAKDRERAAAESKAAQEEAESADPEAQEAKQDVEVEAAKEEIGENGLLAKETTNGDAKGKEESADGEMIIESTASY